MALERHKLRQIVGEMKLKEFEDSGLTIVPVAELQEKDAEINDMRDKLKEIPELFATIRELKNQNSELSVKLKAVPEVPMPADDSKLTKISELVKSIDMKKSKKIIEGVVKAIKKEL